MTPALLATKLYIPPAPARLVGRPRLLEQLDRGTRCKLTLISAPAGFGKTTLLSQWAAIPHLFKVAWLSLDAGDNDPVRLLAYLIGALRTVHPELGRMHPELDLHEPLPVDVILTTLINEIAGLPVPVVLVLDDFHAVDSPAALDAVSFLIDHLPPSLRLIIASRADPAFALARLRVRGELIEIRSTDLKFTTEDAAAFLNQAMGLRLSPEQVAALEQRTEGWIAGLQMAALSMHDRQDLGSFIASFSGSHRYVLEYLTEEVLQRQPEPVQRFLLETSVLDRLTAPLCEAVTGLPGAQAILEQLEHGNVFVIPLDDERRWYRYHHLFADLLRARLTRLDSARVAQLQRSASEWHLKRGEVEEAIAYTLSARDLECAADLIERHGVAMMAQGRSATVVGWINALPEEILFARLPLALLQVRALFGQLKHEDGEDRLSRIEKALTPETPVRIRAETQDLRGVYLCVNGRFKESHAYLQDALELLPDEELLLRGETWLHLGMGYLDVDLRHAPHAFSQAATLLEEAGYVQGALNAAYYQAQSETLLGKLRESSASCRRAMALADKTPNWPAAGYALIGMGELLYEWNDLDGATKVLERAYELGERNNHLDVLISVTLALARVHRVYGEFSTAMQRLEQCAHLVAQIPAANTAFAQIYDEQARLYLCQGRIAEAMQLVNDKLNVAPVDGSLTIGFKRLARARVQIARGESREALAQLPGIQEQLDCAALLGLALQAMVLQALALHACGEGQAANAVFTRALTFAQPEGFVRTFVDEGLRLQPLLAAYRSSLSAKGAPVAEDKRQELLPYVDKLLAALQAEMAPAVPIPVPPPAIPVQSPARPAPPASHPDLSEPLTEREIEVLRLISQGMSYQAIANKLVVSLSTVQWHIRNIYQKLDVHSGLEAVARAREYHLF